MSDLAEKLKSLEKCKAPKFVKIAEVPSNVKLPVVDIGRLETRYGPTTVVTLLINNVTKKVFLPKRFLKLTEDDIKEMLKKDLVLEKREGTGQSPDIIFS